MAKKQTKKGSDPPRKPPKAPPRPRDSKKLPKCGTCTFFATSSEPGGLCYGQPPPPPSGGWWKRGSWRTAPEVNRDRIACHLHPEHRNK